MAALQEPISPEVLGRLRRAVLEHAQTERRRVFAPVLHVGAPGGGDYTFVERPAEPMDHALRTDVVAALLRRTTQHDPWPGVEPMVWLTRSGELELQDVDAQWLAAASAAFAEAGRELTMVVVNRHGWRDPRSAASRTWKRLRQR